MARLAIEWLEINKKGLHNLQTLDLIGGGERI